MWDFPLVFGSAVPTGLRIFRSASVPSTGRCWLFQLSLRDQGTGALIPGRLDTTETTSA